MAAGQGTYLFRLLPGKYLSRNFCGPSADGVDGIPIPVMKSLSSPLWHAFRGLGGRRHGLRTTRLPRLLLLTRIDDSGAAMHRIDTAPRELSR